MTADFETLIRQHSGRIRRIAMRYVAPGETEDLVQDILLALWRNYGEFRGESKVATWLYRVALNVAISGVRKQASSRRKNAQFTGMYQESSAPAGLPADDILSDFLNSLNDVDASVMMMTLDGMSPTDIEDVIGTSTNAISVRISRIRQKFIYNHVD